MQPYQLPYPGQINQNYGNFMPNNTQMPMQQSDNPQGMSPQPTSTLPPLYPNYANPQVNPPQPFSSPNLAEARYAKGGRVGLSQMANVVRRQGQGGDSILAHISPEEANEMSRMYGHNINPRTGLPQYGFFKKMFGRKADNFMKKALPVLGTIVGTALGGPMGGAVGGALGGGIASRNHAKGALRGGLGGLAGGIGLPMLGNALGASGTLGSLMGTGHPGIGSQLGNIFGGMGGAGGLSSIFGNGNEPPGPPAGPGGGMFEGLGSILGGQGLTNILGLGALAGGIGGRERIPYEAPISQSGNTQPNWRSDQYPRQGRLEQSNQTNNRNLTNPGFEPEELYFNNINPAMHYAHGGHLNGHTGGQDDLIPAMLSDGEYVIDSSTVSDLGDGNNQSGANKLQAMVQAIRSQKRTSGKKLPPKSKSIDYYMKMGRK